MTEMAQNSLSQFTTGEHVVYPTHGVGKVIGHESRKISGIEIQMLIVNFERDKMTLCVPYNKVQSLGVRRLSGKKILKEALKVATGSSKVKRTMWSRRAQQYEAKINSGDLISISEVVRDLHKSADRQNQSFSERQLYELALSRMAGEFAAVSGNKEQDAAIMITKHLKGKSSSH